MGKVNRHMSKHTLMCSLNLGGQDFKISNKFIIILSDIHVEKTGVIAASGSMKH